MDTVPDRPDGHRDNIRKCVITRHTGAPELNIVGDRELSVSGPSPRLLSILHRDHPGAFVSLAHKPRGGKFVQPVSIRAREIAELLPGFARLLLEDSYFTLNGQRRPARWDNTLGVVDRRGVKLHAGERSIANTRFLTCCWADLDVRDESPFDALSRAYGLVHARQLPLWSVTLFSGRGVWLIWLLAEAGTEHQRVVTSTGEVSTGQPVKLNPERARYFRAIMRAIGRECDTAQLHPDHGAQDLARVARIPGSTNTNSGATVMYQATRRAGDDSIVAYTMQQLGRLLKVADRGADRAMRANRPVSPETRAKRQRARLIGLRQRRDRLVQLIGLRGGVPKGERTSTLLIFGVLERYLVDTGEGAWRSTRPELLQSLHAFNGQHCHPPLEDTEVRAMHTQLLQRRPEFNNGVGSSWSITDRTIAERLRITSTERDLLGGGRCAGQIDDPPATTPRMLANHRRETIRQLIANRGGEVPPAAVIVDLLNARGIPAKPWTVRNDLRSLFGITRQHADDPAWTTITPAAG
jgi:hypothetical protein